MHLLTRENLHSIRAPDDAQVAILLAKKSGPEILNIPGPYRQR
jgi:hypothetical protein